MKKDSNVNRVYAAIKCRAANFEFKPDARINETTLSAELGASRTPLREALNRLVAEGFLTFQSGRGFFCRPLSPSLVLDLYEARVAVEVETTRLACKRASDDELLLLKRQMKNNSASSPAEILLERDEAFHLAIARMSQNNELQRMLQNLNERIRYIRRIYFKVVNNQNSTAGSMLAHSEIIAALIERDEENAVALMRQHVQRRREDAAQAVRIAYSQLYVPQED